MADEKQIEGKAFFTGTSPGGSPAVTVVTKDGMILKGAAIHPDADMPKDAPENAVHFTAEMTLKGGDGPHPVKLTPRGKKGTSTSVGWTQAFGDNYDAIFRKGEVAEA